MLIMKWVKTATGGAIPSNLPLYSFKVQVLHLIIHALPVQPLCNYYPTFTSSVIHLIGRE